MIEISQDRSCTEMTASIEANLFAFFPLFRHLPKAEVHIGSDWMWAVSDAPYPLFNSILCARLASERADAHIEAAKDRAHSRRVPLLWWVGPATRPADLGNRLTAHGFVHGGDAPGMAADLDKLNENASPSDFAIEEVNDIEALHLWCRTTAAGFEMPDFAERAWQCWFNNIGLGPHLRHYLGSCKGQPVAAASLFLGAALQASITLQPFAMQDAGASGRQSRSGA